MGLAISGDTFDEKDYARFSTRLNECLAALGELLARPGFGEGEETIGAELEMFLVDAEGHPLPANREVLARTMDSRLTVEIDRFNLECNARPCPLAGRPFAALRAELASALAEVSRAAAAQGGRVITIGMLPTFRREDFGGKALTDLPRYRALSQGVRRLRGEPFHLRIHGEDPLAFDIDDVTLEGACTSFQVHLRVDPGNFARAYNAVQLATIPALAVAGNAPILVGHRLWEETRIAVFKQSADDRGDLDAPWHPPARVSFGHGWTRAGALELFAESVAMHAPLLPVLVPEDPMATVRAGGVPALAELRLHQGTVWRWNRAVYDPVGGGHVRIEMRSLPAGPTMADMLANAAFALGLSLGLMPDVDRILPAYPFATAQYAFYRAAQQGLDSLIPWPSVEVPSPRLFPARELCAQLLPVARRGLLEHGVDPGEVEEHLGVIAERVASGRTGARWQRAVLDSLLGRMPREQALRELLERYAARSASGEPVHRWPVDE